ncbi:DUF481 domain-containing protein [Bdellovibrio sp. HCB209]|uniref:DUF481 domain-containing protein n=1 Tax=Bdellovibrio sp. HCB209 TaxID=3394354 RepID=UPI0039B4EBF4
MVINRPHSKLKSLLILILLSFVACPALAFINIESLRQIDGKGYLGQTTLQVSGQQGNTDKFTSQASTMGVYRLDINEWLYTASYKYGTSANVRDTNLGSGHIRHTWNYQEPIAYEAFIQSGFDEFKRLNSRNYVGGNLRFRLLHSEDNRLYAGTGAFYEVEDFEGQDEDTEGLRGNIYISHVARLNETVTSSTTIYYQPKFKDLENYRLRFMTGLDVRINETLSLDVDFNLVNDSGLPEGVKQTDIDYLVGFSVKY